MTSNGGPAVVYTASRTITRQGRRIMREAVMDIPKLVGRPSLVVSGAAVGGDTVLCLLSLLMYPDSEHLVAVPDYNHNEDLVFLLLTWMLIQDAPKITVVETGLQPLDRNGYMLERGDVLFAFPSTSNEQMRGSGTWACIRWARKRATPIYVFPLNGEDPWIENVLG